MNSMPTKIAVFLACAVALVALPLVMQTAGLGQGWVRILALALLYVLLARDERYDPEAWRRHARTQPSDATGMPTGIPVPACCRCFAASRSAASLSNSR